MSMKRTVGNHFGVTGRWLYIWLMVTNSSSMLLFGYDQGVFGSILTLPGFETKFGIRGNETLKGVIVGSYDLGCLVGALATGPIGGWMGRKRSILLGTIIMMVGAFMQFLAPSFLFMTMGRVIAGIGNGINTATAPVWASETSKTSARGRTGMTLMVVNIGGLAISCWMTYFFSFVRSELAWRFPLGFQLFFVLIIYGTAFWLPESPRWLIMKHRNHEALDVMIALDDTRARSVTWVRQDFEEIKRSIALEQSSDIKKNTKPLFRLILGVGVQAMQQLTGINIICYYLPYVLTQSVGLEGSRARLLAAVNAMTYLGSTFIGLYFIERWGRRRLMMFGALGQCCCWLAITVLLSQASNSDGYSSSQVQLGSAAVFFFFAFNCFFGAGWQGVSWLYPTEINSTRYRITGMSYGVATNWLINFGVVFVTPLGIAKLGSQFYVIWTILNALMVPIIWIFYPETAGRSLEDLDRVFEAHPTIWAFTHLSMVSRRPPPGLSGGIPEVIEGVEMEGLPVLDMDRLRFYGIEQATVASRPSSGGLSQIEIRNGNSARHRQAEGHPGSLVGNSFTVDGGRGDDADVAHSEGIDLTHASTVQSSQTGPSLGPQTSTRPLL